MRQIRVIVIPADETQPPQVRTIDADLDGFRAVIDGGWIEAVSGRGFTLYCDEEGKNKGLRVNRRATLVLRHLWPRFPDVIMGPAFLCGEPDRRGDDTDVSAEVVQAADETWGTALSAPR